jgi:peptide/nickel transport system permease protein
MGLRLTHFALIWLILVVLAALLAPWIAPTGPAAVNPSQSLAPPSSKNLLGTDLLGRDVYSRLIWGTRRTLGMALLAVVVSAVPGAGLGFIAGYGGEPWDSWLMRGAETVMALPQLLIALVMVTALGSSPWSVGLALGVAGIASFARLVRSAVQQVSGKLYLQAAEVAGASLGRIATHHILPNIAGSLIAFTSIHFAWAILNSAMLTFLGFGGSPTMPDWGLMLNEGRLYFISAPWISTAPGIAITLTVLAANALGNVMRDS